MSTKTQTYATLSEEANLTMGVQVSKPNPTGRRVTTTIELGPVTVYMTSQQAEELYYLLGSAMEEYQRNPSTRAVAVNEFHYMFAEVAKKIQERQAEAAAEESVENAD